MEDRISEEDHRLMLEWLEGKLEPLPQTVRSNLPEEAVSYFHGDEEERKMLLDRVRGLLNVYKDRAASAGAARTGRGKELREVPQEIEVELDEYTQRRGELLAELAELRPDVRHFRESYLRGSLLTAEEAEAFLAGRQTGRGTLDRRIAARGRLRRLAGRLAGSYGWRERAAERFVLTGRPPELLSVAVGFGESTRDYVPNTASIVVMADVRVSVDEVAEAFRAAQRQLLGGDNRKKEEALKVVRFVVGQIREHGSRPPWRELLKTWNHTHKKSYKSHNALVNAFEQFVHPEYNRPKWKRRDTS
jgi:hypothetical protein